MRLIRLVKNIITLQFVFDFVKNYREVRRRESEDNVRNNAVDYINIRRVSIAGKIVNAVIVKNVIIHVDNSEKKGDISDLLLKIRDLYYDTNCRDSKIKFL